jgi:RadC-like JAB domain-containing protein
VSARKVPRDHVRPYRLQQVTLRLRRSQGPRLPATSAAALARAFQHLATEPRESLWGFYVSPANEVIVYERISTGGLLGTGAEPAEVTRTALLAGACTVILLHNHPAGNPEPSGEDRRFTREIEEALRLFDIRLGDHIILAPGGHFYSFYEHHELPTPAPPRDTRDATQSLYTVSWSRGVHGEELVIEQAALTPRQADALRRHLHNQAAAGHLCLPAVVPFRSVPLSCKHLLRQYPILRFTRNPSLPLEILDAARTRNTHTAR